MAELATLCFQRARLLAEAEIGHHIEIFTPAWWCVNKSLVYMVLVLEDEQLFLKKITTVSGVDQKWGYKFSVSRWMNG